MVVWSPALSFELIHYRAIGELLGVLMSKRAQSKDRSSRRKSVDDAFAGMAEDPIYQEEAHEIAEEFSAADWEAFEIAEGNVRRRTISSKKSRTLTCKLT